MEHLVELLDSAIDYIGLDQPDVVPALAEARAVIDARAAQERAELAAELAGLDGIGGRLVGRNGRAPTGFDVSPGPAPDTAFTMSPAGVRAAVVEVLSYHDRTAAGHQPDIERYERARQFLDALPPLPGQLGQAVSDVFHYARPHGWDEKLTGWAVDPDGSNLEGSLTKLARAVGARWAGPGDEAPSPVVGPERVAGLQEARDTALDRAIGATLRAADLDAQGKSDPCIAADARSWARVHDRAVDGLARAGAAEVPRARTASADRGGMEEALTVATGDSPAHGARPPGADPWW